MTESRIHWIKTLLASLIITVSAPCFADFTPGFFTQSQTRMGVDYITFSGDKYNSLAAGSPGYGIEVGQKLSNSTFSVFGKIRGIYTSGTESFLDGSTSEQLTYLLMTGEVYLGALYHLIPSSESGFRPYIGAAGGAGIIDLRFPASSVTTLAVSQTAMSLGYEFIAGLELNTKYKTGLGMWSIYGEFIMRTMRANLAGQSPFYFDGITLAGGIGW
jgi:hypothetical protein